MQPEPYRPMRGDQIRFAKGNHGFVYRIDKIEEGQITVSNFNGWDGMRWTHWLTPGQFEALEPELIYRDPDKGQPYGKTKARARYLLMSFSAEDCQALITWLINHEPVVMCDAISAYYEEHIEGKKFGDMEETACC